MDLSSIPGMNPPAPDANLGSLNPGPINQPLPGTMNIGSGSMNQGPGFMNQGPGSMNQGPGSMNQGPGSMSQGPGSMKQGPGSMAPGTAGPDYAALLQYLQYYQKQMGSDETEGKE